MRWPRSESSPVGLDLGVHTFKAVQRRRGRVTAAVALPRATPDVPLSEADLKRLRTVLARQGFVGRDVVIAVPPAALASSVLELPAKTPGLPLTQLASAEFARLHKLDDGGLTVSTWELPPSAKASRATGMLAVGAKVAAIGPHLALLDAAGFAVVAADDPYSAAARGGLGDWLAAGDLSAVVDLGWSAATLSVVRGGVLVYTRRLADAALARLCKTAVESGLCDAADAERQLGQCGFDGDDAELRAAVAAHFAAALRELGLAFGYATHQYPDAELSRVLLVGGGATLPGVERKFTDALGVPARTAAAAVAPPLATALGLALWQEAAR